LLPLAAELVELYDADVALPLEVITHSREASICLLTLPAELEVCPFRQTVRVFPGERAHHLTNVQVLHSLLFLCLSDPVGLRTYEKTASGKRTLHLFCWAY
jgi:hypothetical protein